MFTATEENGIASRAMALDNQLGTPMQNDRTQTRIPEPTVNNRDKIVIHPFLHGNYKRDDFKADSMDTPSNQGSI